MTLTFTELSGNWNKVGGYYKQENSLTAIAAVYFGVTTQPSYHESKVRFTEFSGVGDAEIGIGICTNITCTKGYALRMNYTDGTVELYRYISDNWYKCASYTYTSALNTFYRLAINYSWSSPTGTIVCYLDGTVITWTTITADPNPGSGVTITSNVAKTIVYDNTEMTTGIQGLLTVNCKADFDYVKVSDDDGSYSDSDYFINVDYSNYDDIEAVMAVADGNLDKELLQQIGAQCKSEIDSALSTIYVVPFTNIGTYSTGVPPLIKTVYELLCKGQYYRQQYQGLVGSREMPGFEIWLKDARAMLEQIKKGDLPLLTSAGTQITPTGDDMPYSYRDHTLIASTTPADGLTPSNTEYDITGMELHMLIDNTTDSITGTATFNGYDTQNVEISVPIEVTSEVGDFIIPGDWRYLSSVDALELNDGTTPTIKIYAREYF